MKLTKLFAIFSSKTKSCVSCTQTNPPTTTATGYQDVQNVLSSEARSFVGCRERSLTPATPALPATSSSWTTYNTSTMLSIVPAPPPLQPVNTVRFTSKPDADSPLFNERRNTSKRRYEAYCPAELIGSHRSAEISDDNIDYRKDLEGELRRISHENERQLDQIRQLQYDLEQQHRIATCLQASKFSSRRELRKKIALLIAEGQEKEQVISQLGTKYKGTKAQAQCLNKISEMEKLVLQSAELMDLCAEVWERLKTEVERREKQVLRKERGLGMQWPFTDVDGKFP